MDDDLNGDVHVLFNDLDSEYIKKHVRFVLLPLS